MSEEREHGMANEPEPEEPELGGAGSEGRQEKSEQQEIMDQARERYHEFYERYHKTIQGYFGSESVHFTLQPGGWYIDLDSGRVNADPAFFLERGYTEAEALFATFHEAEHFRDAAQDPAAYRNNFDQIEQLSSVHPAYPKQLKRFFNCLDDVMVNNAVVGRWKAGAGVRDGLYREKLFPEHDFKGQPKYRQFMYALLRESMLPDQTCLVDDNVREMIDEWQKRSKRDDLTMTHGLNAFDIRTQTAKVPAAKRYEQILIALEPKFRQLFLDDVREAQEKQVGQREFDPFGEDPLEGAIPDSLSPEEILGEIEKYQAARGERKDIEFKDSFGIERKDFLAYQKDAQAIQPYIDELSELFNRLIQERIHYRRRLSKPAKEGPMLDRSKLAIGAAEIKAGNLEPEIFLDYEPEKFSEQRPSRIDMHLVVDGTGSVTGDAEKIVMQRRTVILFLEAIKEFRKKIVEANAKGAGLELKINTQVREFAETDRVHLPLSSEIDHHDRVRIYKELTFGLMGGDNNERDTFENLLSEISPEAQQEMRSGDLKKIILVLTDGGTNLNMQQYMKRLSQKAGTEQGFAIGAIGYGKDGKEVETVYRPVGVYAPKVNQLPKVFENMLANMLSK